VSALWPGATIGIVGAGQLARMLAFEARRMGYRVLVLAQTMDDPAVPLADRALLAGNRDDDPVEQLALEADAITFDYEHVPGAVLERLDAHPAVHPAPTVLRILQDRLTQREFLDTAGVPHVTYAPVADAPTLADAAARIGMPCVLKTRRSGYDGRGQVVIGSPENLEAAWRGVGARPAILEPFVDFARELSIVAARDRSGEMAFYPVVENVHRRHVLRATRAPAALPGRIAARARAIASRLAASLQYVGVLAVEFFLTRDGELLVNEVAPRTHNSGHYTYGACVTSQFEQHLRAICGLPLGDPALMRPAVMVNLLGDDGPLDRHPGWRQLLQDPRARLHLYGKRENRPGRKMGHVLILGDDDASLNALLGSLLEERDANRPLTVP
jgi:5-(carboxyamino)imidazole ribonucleotide synthase